MSEIRSAQLTSCSPADPRWALVQRVADSQYFCKGPKLRAFLLYVCENTLAGSVDNIREQLIGSKVFGRPAEYNLGGDNIVRVEAREVRKRLALYFAGEGRGEPIVIDIPKGTYIPVFKPREEASPDAADTRPQDAEAKTAEQGETETSGAPGAAAAASRRLVSGLAAALVVAVGAVIWLARENHQLQQTAPVLRPGASARDYAVYPDLLGGLGAVSNRDTLLVLSNPKVVLYFGSETEQPVRRAAGLTVPAPKELRSTFSEALNNLDRNTPFQFLSLTNTDYTGMGEAVAAFHVGRLMQFLRRPVRITQGRFLNWDQVQKQDLVLLGGPQINDWTNQNVAKTNFSFGMRGVENAKPLPGEQPRYSVQIEPDSKPGAAFTDYGLIKMWTSPYGFKLLLLAGASSSSTAGVADFFTTPGKMKDLHKRIGGAGRGGSFPSDWEALLKLTVRDGLVVESSVIAVRPAAGAH